MSRDQRIDQSATSIQSLLNTNGATFLMTSHVRSALWTLLIMILMVKTHIFCFLHSKDNFWTTIPQNGLSGELVILSHKVHIFWEDHKILRNPFRWFDCYTIGQIYGKYFAKFCGLLRIYVLSLLNVLVWIFEKVLP